VAAFPSTLHVIDVAPLIGAVPRFVYLIPAVMILGIVWRKSRRGVTAVRSGRLSAIANPADRAGRVGAGPRYWLG
jgi:hypothetical protein